MTRSLILAIACRPAARLSAEPGIPPAIGPHVGLDAADFAGVPSWAPSDRIVGTYYFYRCDSQSRSHIINGDGGDALT
jgi:hypothetical protein